MSTAVSEEFQQAAEELLSGTVRQEEIRAELAEGFSASLWGRVMETGWTEVLVPEDFGGLGLGLAELGPILKVAGRHLVPGPLIEHATVLPLLATAGLDLEDERLDELRRGTRKLAVAGLGESVDKLPRLTDGTLSGTAMNVRYGDLADDLLVFCSDEQGLLAALIPTDRDAVAVAQRRSLDPIASTADINFPGTAVAPSELLSDAAARTLGDRAIALQRLLVSCELSGIAERSLEMAVSYAKEREQFGRPIGAFQAVQQLLAQAAKQSHGIDCLCRESLAAADRSESSIGHIAIVTKAGVAAPSREVVECSLQVHGGIAFTIEHEMHGYYTHALSLEALHGTTRELTKELGHGLIGGSSSWPEW